MPKRRDYVGGPSLEGLAGLVAGFVLGYLAVEGALAGPNHPIHWFLASVTALAGYLVGALAGRLKERRAAPGTFSGHARDRRHVATARNRPQRRRR